MTLGIVVLVPLAAAGACLVAGRRLALATGMAGSLATAGVAVWVALRVRSEGYIGEAAGGWEPPVGIALRADGLSALMLLMTAAVALAASVHALRSRPLTRGGWLFWPLWLGLWAALNAVFVAGDLFNVYVSLELVTLPAVALVCLGSGVESLRAAMRYLLAALIGSLAYLLGVALLYGEVGTLDLEAVSETIAPGVVVSVAIASLTAGLMLKAALFPLHFWLPQAHARAPAAVSAALSALVVTAAAYLVLRLWLYSLAPALGIAAVELVGALGAAAIVWGSIGALRAERLKLLIAYSTVAQLGYLFVLIALAWDSGPADATAGVASGAASAWQGGIYHAVSHALAKAAVFLAAGNVILSVGHDRLSALTGLAARLPLTVGALVLASVSLAGLPPSGGFSAKWMMLVGALEQGAWWWGATIVIGGLLAAAYMLRVVGQAFRRDVEPVERRDVPQTMQVAALALAIGAIAMGIFSAELLELLEAAP